MYRDISLTGIDVNPQTAISTASNRATMIVDIAEVSQTSVSPTMTGHVISTGGRSGCQFKDVSDLLVLHGVPQWSNTEDMSSLCFACCDLSAYRDRQHSPTVPTGCPATKFVVLHLVRDGPVA